MPDPKVEYYYVKTLEEGCKIFRQEERTSINVSHVMDVSTEEEARHEVDRCNEKLRAH